MASVIKIKRSSVAGKVPTISDIATGELAINVKDQKLYSSNGTAVFQISGASSGGGSGSSYANASVSKSQIKNLTQNDYVVTDVTGALLAMPSYLQVANAIATYQTKSVERAALANTNAYIATKASWTGLTGTNTAIRTLVSDRLQIANASATYQTKTVERAALANTNAYIATKASTGKAIAMAIVFGG